MIFKGVCTALVTPFNRDNSIDYKALTKLIEFQLNSKVDAILILGSTGESSTISHEERKQFISFTKKLTKGKCKLIVGASSNDTLKAVKLVNEAKYLGADACLICSPYYNKCTQNGLYLHYKIISENTNCPIIVYNVPSRTGVNILPSTMQKIANLNNIVGLKEANGDINHILEMVNALNGKLPIYSGNDNLNHIFYSLNAKGVISVTSNVYPKEVVKSQSSLLNSLTFHNKYYNFNKLMFIEPNPIPIKYALYKKHLIKNILRMPLTKLEIKNTRLIIDEMLKLGASK